MLEHFLISEIGKRQALKYILGQKHRMLATCFDCDTAAREKFIYHIHRDCVKMRGERFSKRTTKHFPDHPQALVINN